MEGAEAGPEPGLYRCLLCAWATPSRLAVLQHLRTPAHRDAQAQRRLRLLQNGPAAEEGLSALQSILSFSHGRLRTPGEEEGTGAHRLGRRRQRQGHNGVTEESRKRVCEPPAARRKAWGKGREGRMGASGTGRFPSKERNRRPQEDGREWQRLCRVRNRKTARGNDRDPVILSND